MPSTVISVSSLPLEFALFCYLGACILYMLWLILGKEILGKVASACIGGASVLLAFYIYNRWSIAGHPPFAGKFESLIAFAWCIGVVYLILEWFIGMRHGGAGASLIAALMLASTWLLDNTIQPLMPALQDNFWLTTHVLLCFLGYAGFAVAFVLAVLHLLSSPNRINRAGVMVVYIGIALFLMAKCWLSIPESDVTLWWALRRVLPLIIMHMAILATLLYGDMPTLKFGKTRKRRATILLLTLSVLLTASGYLASKALPLPMRQIAGGGSVLDLIACAKAFAPTMLLGILSMAIVLTFADLKQINPELGKKLGRASYLCATFGFPFLGMGIITGSVWASQAWGRYWGWDPKETSSLLAWCIYAIYLHLRVVAGAKRISLSWIVVIGFWVVLFTYFGVNYLSLLGVDSLHIYSQ